MLKETSKFFLILPLCLILFVLFFGGNVPMTNDNKVDKVEASDQKNISGYAWSDNIGWISFNSLDIGLGIDYGVLVDMDTGKFSGYAWSDNIGWIDFSPSSGYPSSPSHNARLKPNNSVVGWARVLSYGDGWDGWINMDGVVLNEETGMFSGYAWGSDVVGWLSFNFAQLFLGALNHLSRSEASRRSLRNSGCIWPPKVCACLKSFQAFSKIFSIFFPFDIFSYDFLLITTESL